MRGRWQILVVGFFFALTAGIASAGDEDELGIEMKNKSADPSAAAAGKARTLAGKYEKAKQGIAQTIGAGGSTTLPPPEVSLPAKADRTAPPAVQDPGIVIHLQNGQTLTGATILREDDGGLWVHMEGMEVYFTKQEIKSVERL